MNRKIQLIALTVLTAIAFLSCNDRPASEQAPAHRWNLNALKDRSTANLDSSQWDRALLKQDMETYGRYAELFEQYPLNNYPFPVANYNYAVFSTPFTINMDSHILKGIRIGEYTDPNSDSMTTRLTLIVLTNDDLVEPETFVDSRNYPYLTAEGNFNLPHHQFEWVFAATPDGFANLFFSMKLFDLRFGETIIIYPKADGSFVYEQLNESPDDHPKLEDYINVIKANARNASRLKGLSGSQPS